MYNMNNLIKLASRVGRGRPQLKLNRSQIEDFVSNAKQLQRSSVKYEFALPDKPGAVVSLPRGKFALVTERNGIPYVTRISSKAVNTIKAQRKAMADMANRRRAEALREKEKTTPQPDPNDPKPVPEPQLLEEQRKLWRPKTWFKGQLLNVNELNRHAAGLKPGETKIITTHSGKEVIIAKDPNGNVYQSYSSPWKRDLLTGGITAVGTTALSSLASGTDEVQAEAPAPTPATTQDPAPTTQVQVPAPTTQDPAPASAPTQVPTPVQSPTQAPTPVPATTPTTLPADPGLWDQINNSDIVKWMKANPGTTLGVGLGVPAALLAIDSLLDDDDEEEEETRKMRKRMRRLGY